MSGIWNDFNSAQSNSNVIPKGTLARVRLTIRPGGFDDLDLSRFCSGLLRAILAIKETGYGSNTQR